MATMKDRIAEDGVLGKVIVGDTAVALLDLMDIQAAPVPAGDPGSPSGEKGEVKFKRETRLLGLT